MLPDIRSSSDGCRPATSAPVESRFVPLESAGAGMKSQSVYATSTQYRMKTSAKW